MTETNAAPTCHTAGYTHCTINGLPSGEYASRTNTLKTPTGHQRNDSDTFFNARKSTVSLSAVHRLTERKQISE